MNEEKKKKKSYKIKLVYKINGNTEKEIRNKQRTNKKNHQTIFFLLNFSSFIKKTKSLRYHHSPITQAQTIIKSI